MKKILAIFAFMFSVIVFSGCVSTKNQEKLLVRYTYNVTRENYIYVWEYHCISVDVDSYDVKKAVLHLFSKTNDKYKDRSGQELIDMTRLKIVIATATKDVKQTKDVTVSITVPGWDSKITYNISEGTPIKEKFYF